MSGFEILRWAGLRNLHSIPLVDFVAAHQFGTRRGSDTHISGSEMVETGRKVVS